MLSELIGSRRVSRDGHQPRDASSKIGDFFGKGCAPPKKTNKRWFVQDTLCNNVASQTCFFQSGCATVMVGGWKFLFDRLRQSFFAWMPCIIVRRCTMERITRGDFGGTLCHELFKTEELSYLFLGWLHKLNSFLFCSFFLMFFRCSPGYRGFLRTH